MPSLCWGATVMESDMLRGSQNLELLIFDIRQRVIEVGADLEPLFNKCACEARFGLFVIDTDLHHLSSCGRILEIGAGVLLLGCHLQREGYAVTAIEPAGCGFSHFDRLRKIVLEYASEGDFAPAFFTTSAEDLDFESDFDFAYSINVMEHVGNVALVLRRVLSAIRPGGRYRFLCPNYMFPYEPHFNMPTLFSKVLTEYILGKWIRSSRRIVDPQGLWMSLNWISVPHVRHICRDELGVEPVFDGSVLYRFIKRALYDSEFQNRHGSLILNVLQTMDRMGMTRFSMRVPVVCQPAMDCFIVRKE